MPPFNRKSTSSDHRRTHSLSALSGSVASTRSTRSVNSDHPKSKDQRNLLKYEVTSSDAYLSDVENDFRRLKSMDENSALTLAASAAFSALNSAGEESACDSDIPLTASGRLRRGRSNDQGRSRSTAYNHKRKGKSPKIKSSNTRPAFATDSIVDDDENDDVRDDGAGWSESDVSDAPADRTVSAGRLMSAAKRYSTRRRSNKKKSTSKKDNDNSFDGSCDSELSDASNSGASTESTRSKNLVKADRTSRRLWRSKSKRTKKNAKTESKDSDVSDLSDASDAEDSRKKKTGGKAGGNLAGKSKKRMKSIMKSFQVTSSSSSTSGTGTTDTTAPPSPRPGFDDMDYDLDSRLVPVSLSPSSVGLKYSLRSAVGDGGARQPNSASVMQRRDLTPNGCHLDTSHWSHRGRRSYMEDRYAIEELGVLTECTASLWNSALQQHTQSSHDDCENEDEGVESNSVPMTWFAIFDGHGGERASQFCVDWLSSYVRHHASFPSDLGTVLRDSFRSVDGDFVRTGLQDGTTACTCIVQGRKRIFCANAGDSRAIVVRRDGSIVRLSRDHKPGLLDETKRITDLGGKVIYWGRWRVEGLLAVSRSVGDAALKPYVTADPEICEYDIEDDDMFLVIASDGIWDVLSNEQVSKIVITHSCYLEGACLNVDTERLRWTARKLCEKARKNGSSDNFAAVVTNLRSG